MIHTSYVDGSEEICSLPPLFFNFTYIQQEVKPHLLEFYCPLYLRLLDIRSL